MANALLLALRSLWLGEEPPYEEVLGREGDEREVRELLSGLWVKCYPQGDKRLCVYSYKRPPKDPVPLLLDARGTVIEWSKDGPELVAYPFHKFFNLGEAEFPERPLLAYEKLDGTMVSLFLYDGEVRAATRKKLDVDSPFAKKALELFEGELGDETRVFELLGPGSGSPWVGGTQELLRAGEWSLVPLAYRDMKTLKLYPLEGPTRVEVEDLEDAKRKAEGFGEGLVLWFEVGSQRPLMAKVKSVKYKRLVDLLKLGWEGLAKIILMNALDDAARMLDNEVYSKAKAVEGMLDEIERAVLRGEFPHERVREWLPIDPSRALEEAVRVCLEEGC
ncbi:RNA ligase [Ignicoccus hospitalis]|uniref:T4 RNA ligase 1-like N-terminal domain-containing protein n=1 Tax=Ignicoccus hospitalis (strain KIN4/I / DSM 18386 / JCM 14125) TaxID=453591 RepID=A8A9V6_IGNH4|nr:RNA ligase [Ignicoccus hospitalis]ABU81708.1 hypothetical protein Igni_0526 [Ignicoccus hospitalis KIN4/I]HIH89971.1 hypothetical protein [Desulfurococcaceae archaeon]